MPDIFEVDVAGSDVFSRNYSVAVVYNNSKRYGYRFDREIQEKLTRNNASNKYCIDNKKSFKPRVYSAILILILRKICKIEKINSDYKFLICNDLDGHFDQICNMLITHLQNEMPNLDKKRHMSICRHSKNSLIQKTVSEIFNGNFEGKTIYKFKLDEIEEILNKCRFRL